MGTETYYYKLPNEDSGEVSAPQTRLHMQAVPLSHHTGYDPRYSEMFVEILRYKRHPLI